MTLRTPIQFRFSDFDIFRHVNNVSQQMFFDTGKTDFFARTLGDGALDGRLRLVTVRTETSYLGQIRLGDRIEVETRLERIGDRSLSLLQRLVAPDGGVRSESRTVLVAFDFDRQQSIRVPDAWRRKLARTP